MVDLSSPVFKELLMDELDIDPNVDAKLAQNVDRYITIYSDKVQAVQYWYVRRHVLLYQLRRAAELVDNQTGPDKVNASQKFRNLRTMLIDAENQIANLFPEESVPSVSFSRPTHSTSVVNTNYGYFELLGWPGPDDCFWDNPICLKG